MKNLETLTVLTLRSSEEYETERKIFYQIQITPKFELK